MSMSKTLGKSSITRGRDRGDTLEPIPETVNKPFRKTNLLIIKKLNFNFTKEVQERDSTKERNRKESVTSSGVDREKRIIEKSEINNKGSKQQDGEEGQCTNLATNEKNKSLLNSLRGNRFNNPMNNKLVLSSSIGRTLKKPEKPIEDSITPKNKIIIEAIPKKEELKQIKKKSKKDLVLPSISENKEKEKSDSNKEISHTSKVLKDSLILKKESKTKEENLNIECQGSQGSQPQNSQNNKPLSISNINPVRNFSIAKTKAKFDYIYNPFKEREESLDRYSQVRESFKEKKLHIFNKTDKYLYVRRNKESYFTK
jgi:hypothetical protein